MLIRPLVINKMCYLLIKYMYEPNTHSIYTFSTPTINLNIKPDFWVVSCIIIDALYRYLNYICYANWIPPLMNYLFLVISWLYHVLEASVWCLHLCFHGQGIQWWHFANCQIIMLMSCMLISTAINELSISGSVTAIKCAGCPGCAPVFIVRRYNRGIVQSLK